MPPYSRKTAIAHRGASSYAPEHTLESYRLAIAQNADYVEQDLQITRDGVLVCLHDVTLERTTNVEQVFPDRATLESSGRHWYVWDFTLEEIKTLDAGSWFGEAFRGAQIPTWQEAVDVVRGKAGLCPETKDPDVYQKRGFDMEALLTDSLAKNRLDPGSTPVIIQSFSPASLKRLSVAHEFSVSLMLLVGREHGIYLSMDGLRQIRTLAEGIAPDKTLLQADADIVKRAHAAGLSVTPYTFCSSDTAFPSVKEEMAFFLNTLGVDAVFTDNPDLFPR